MPDTAPFEILYYLGPKYRSFSSSAVWSDILFGLSNWSRFGQVALVTDVEWIRASARLFMPFFSGDLRVFGAGELNAASAWIPPSVAAWETRPAFDDGEAERSQQSHEDRGATAAEGEAQYAR